MLLARVVKAAVDELMKAELASLGLKPLADDHKPKAQASSTAVLYKHLPFSATEPANPQPAPKPASPQGAPSYTPLPRVIYPIPEKHAVHKL